MDSGGNNADDHDGELSLWCELGDVEDYLMPGREQR